MRLWSINPKYLDSNGLIAVWREGLLAKKVLEGKTIGYKNHPQLERFRREFGNEKEFSKKKSLKLIENYLYIIFLESKKRGYNFDKTKCKNHYLKNIIVVTNGQLKFEFEHLQKKLFKRDKNKYLENKKLLKNKIKVNQLFKTINGEICFWEKIERNL